MVSAEWWTPRELAQRWKRSDDTILRRIKLEPGNPGKINAMKNGGGYLIHHLEIARHEQAALPAPETQTLPVKPVRASSHLASFRRRLHEQREAKSNA
jgi:hypothetical protein